MAKKGKGPIDFKKSIFNEGLTKGLDYFISEHPRFKGKEKFLLGYVDKKKLDKYFDTIYNNLLKKGTIDQKDIHGLVTKLAGKIESADLFSGDGREFILREGLETYRQRPGTRFSYLKAAAGHVKSGQFREAGRTILARGILKKHDYVDQASQAFGQLYDLMKTGDYSERMPEFAKAVNTVKDAGFFNDAAHILFQGNLLNSRKYATMVNQIHKKAEHGTKYISSALEKYAMPEKIAASILAIVGVGVIFTSNTITGGVIGTTRASPLAILWGAAAIILGGFLWTRRK